MISTHPVSLRDGSLIVYCDEEVRSRRGCDSIRFGLTDCCICRRDHVSLYTFFWPVQDRAAAKAKAEAAKQAKGDGGAGGSAKRTGRNRAPRFKPFGAELGGPRGKVPAERGLQIHTRFDDGPVAPKLASEAQQSDGQPEEAVGEQ